MFSFETEKILTNLAEHSEPLKRTISEQHKLEKEEKVLSYSEQLRIQEEKEFFLVTSDNISETKILEKEEISEEAQPNIENLKKRLTSKFPDLIVTSSSSSDDNQELFYHQTYKEQVENANVRILLENLQFQQKINLGRTLDILFRQDAQIKVLEKQIKIMLELWQENENKTRTITTNSETNNFYPLIIGKKTGNNLLLHDHYYISPEIYKIGYRKTHDLPFYEGELLDMYKPDCRGIFIQTSRGLIFAPYDEFSVIARREYEKSYPGEALQNKEIRKFTFLTFHKERRFCLPYYMIRTRDHRKLAHRIIWTKDLIDLLPQRWQEIRRGDPQAIIF